MPSLNEPVPPAQRLAVLHLTGARADDGGIFSVIRALQEATVDTVRHQVWVHSGFRQIRKPALVTIGNPHAIDESPSHLRLLIGALRSWPGLRRLLESESETVVHAHTRGALPLAVWLSRHRPVLFTQHAYARRTGLYRAAVRLPGMRTVLLTPNMARHYGIAESPGRVEILSACYGDHWRAFPLPASRPSLTGRRFRLVGVGNLVRWKRWDVLVDAIAALPATVREKLDCEIWGPTPPDADARAFEAELRDQLQRNALEPCLRFSGPTSSPMEVLKTADAFVLPSTHEPCSVALMEALACGLPVIASRSGGNIDIVRDGSTGLLFEPGNVSDLSAKITALIEGSVSLACPVAIRESVVDRSATVVGAAYLRLYQERAASRRKALRTSAAG
jgi:glycosyltransferase involved in cell wall biosynthesis